MMLPRGMANIESTKCGATGAILSDGTAPPVASGVVRSLLKAALLLCGLLAAGVLLRALPGLNHAMLQGGVLQRGLEGRLVFLGIGTLVCAVGLPRQAVGFAGGFAYGLVWGTLLTTVATLAGCLADLFWARAVGRDWVRRRMRHGRLARLDGFIAANPFSAILTLRLLPVGSSLMVSLFSGILGVRVWPFLAATLLGSLPQTVIFGLLGAGVGIGHGAQLLLGLGLFVASGLVGLYLFFRTAAFS
ncbi:TVP38/TMEM64 family protein [Lichenicoccus sp.]|uniref:TVP38/TMEM64 family protein n=1 Tax=Lichenicoccus sp. TaxID=2781899 RepID=UPI003D120E7A